MKRTLIQAALFLALPVLALELAGLVLTAARGPAGWWQGRMGVENVWYHPEDAVDPAPIDFLFVGTSRTGAAIDEGAFAREIAKAGRPPPRVIKLAEGYSGIVDHYFVLRDLAAADPGVLRGCTVFIEAPDGLPDPSSLADAWTGPAVPNHLVPLLQLRDLRTLWTVSRTPLSLKLRITGMRLSATVRVMTWLRGSIERKGVEFSAAIDGWMQTHRGSPAGFHPAAQADLSSSAGILTDPEAIKVVRQAAIETATADMTAQVPVSDWSGRLLFEIARLVQDNGGKLVVYYMPMSSIQQRPRRTDLRIEDKARFRREAQRRDVVYLRPNFTTTDDDFPDLWHLRLSRAPEFSRSLAAEYLNRIGRP